MPRIYVADLADYSAGRLTGRWYDIDKRSDPDAVEADVAAWLAERGHEESAVHDCEDFGDLPAQLGEYTPIRGLVQLGALIALHGVAFAAWAADRGATYTLETIDDASDAFAAEYCGEYASEADCAQTLAEDTGMLDADAPWPLTCIDWEWAWNELRDDGYWSVPAHDGVYVFCAS